MSRSAVRVLVAVVVLQFPALARAAGQPVLGDAVPSAALRSADGAQRYLAHPQRGQTLVQDVSSTGTLAHAIPGSFAIPMVAYDGSVGGLSADGRTLILTRRRTSFPARASELAVLDPNSLRLIRVIHLRGDFAFDAISPDGRWVYLIQYSSTDATRYRVRALDTRTGRLAAHDITDPRDHGEKMQGFPLSRVSSPDGRWAYTVYAGAGKPFIHALDTARLQARCIDLPAFSRAVQPFSVRLRLAGHVLAVMVGRRTLDTLDTRSWRPVDQPLARKASAGSSASAVAMLAAIVVAAGAVTILRRRSRSR